MVTQQQINEIVNILVTECKPDKIVLFGSYALGTAQNDSDIDIAIVKKTDLPHHKRSIEFRKALRAGGRRWQFGMDILVYTPEEFASDINQNYSFIHEIFTTGKVLYES
jgi:uncharacterized protein